MAAHQAPPSLGFSRQEHWSGLPFPSPMHESESEITQLCPTLHDPMGAAYQTPPPMGFSRQEYWTGLPSLGHKSSLGKFKKIEIIPSIFSDHNEVRLDVKVRVKSLSRLTLCDCMDYCLSSSSVHGIFQARILKWVAISFSRRSSQPRD